MTVGIIYLLDSESTEWFQWKWLKMAATLNVVFFVFQSLAKHFTHLNNKRLCVCVCAQNRANASCHYLSAFLATHEVRLRFILFSVNIFNDNSHLKRSAFD